MPTFSPGRRCWPRCRRRFVRHRADRQHTAILSPPTRRETGTVSSAITVPDNAELVVVTVSGQHGTNAGFAAMTFTKGGVDTAMIKATGGDASGASWQSAMFYSRHARHGGQQDAQVGLAGGCQLPARASSPSPSGVASTSPSRCATATVCRTPVFRSKRRRWSKRRRSRRRMATRCSPSAGCTIPRRTGRPRSMSGTIPPVLRN